jgi:hypothetical protein
VRAGERLAERLTGPALTALFDARAVPGELEARQAVESHRADVAVMIPPGFSAAAAEPQTQATVTVYHHPNSSVGARVVKIVVSDFVDAFAGAKIAIHVVTEQLAALKLALPDDGTGAAAQAYLAWLEAAEQAQGQGQHGASLWHPLGATGERGAPHNRRRARSVVLRHPAHVVC